MNGIKVISIYFGFNASPWKRVPLVARYAHTHRHIPSAPMQKLSKQIQTCHPPSAQSVKGFPDLDVFTKVSPLVLMAWIALFARSAVDADADAVVGAKHSKDTRPIGSASTLWRKPFDIPLPKLACGESPSEMHLTDYSTHRAIMPTMTANRLPCRTFSPPT